MPDAGVADVLGDIMLVAITVALAAALALLVVFQVDPGDPANTRVRVASDADTLALTHTGGKAVPLSAGQVVLTVDGSEQRLELSECPGASGGDPDLWELGETLVLSSPSGSCGSLSGSQITAMNLVLSPPDGGRQLSTSWQGSVAASTPPGPNTPPSAAFTYTPASPETGETITFDASGSNDPDGSITTYAWDWTDDGTYDTTTPSDTTTHSYPNPGTYTVRLRVTDNASATDETTGVVVVPRYVDCPFTVTAGTSSDCANAQSANDGDAVATISETDTDPQPGQANVDYHLDVTATFSSVPSGSTHTLDLRYRVTGTLETIELDVWDGSSWNDRGSLTATSLTTFTYELTSAEYQAGDPQIRFESADPADSDPTTLELAHLRIETS